MTNKSLSETTHALRCRENTERLNREGCEFGRRDAERLNILESEYKSDLKSVMAGQKLFVEDIFPKMKEAVREAGLLTQSAQEAADKMAKDMNWLKWMIIVAVLTQIIVGAMKLFQDSGNQRQLMDCLIKLSGG